MIERSNVFVDTHPTETNREKSDEKEIRIFANFKNYNCGVNRSVFLNQCAANLFCSLFLLSFSGK